MLKSRISRLMLTAVLATTVTVTVKDYTQAQVSVPNDRVLATVNGLQFTQSMANAWVYYGEFLANRQFTPQERAWIVNAETVYFQNNDSQQVIDGTNSLISETFSHIESVKSDPIQLAQYREKLFAQIYMRRVKDGRLNVQDFMTVVYQYVPVVAADTYTGMVVTMQDIDALLASNNFIGQLNPQFNYVGSDRNSTIQDVQQSFHRYSYDTKKFYSQAESRWNALAVGWNSSTPQEQQNMTAEIAQRAANSESFPVIARNLENRFYYNLDKNGNSIVDNIGRRQQAIDNTRVQENQVQLFQQDWVGP